MLSVHRVMSMWRGLREGVPEAITPTGATVADALGHQADAV